MQNEKPESVEKPTRKERGVFQRPGKSGWWVRVFHQGRRRLFLCDTKSQAIALYGKLKAEIREGVYFPDRYKAKAQPAPVRLRSYVKTWLAALPAKGTKPSTVKAYQYRLDKHIIPVFGDLSLTAIDRPAIKTWAARLLERGLDYDTVSSVLTTFASLLSEAVEDRLLVANPVARQRRLLKRPPTIEDAALPIFTPEEEQAVLAAAKTHSLFYYALALTFFRTGCRAGEVLGLHRDDLDFRRRVLHVRRTWTDGRIGTPKSGKARQVDMSKGLATVLRDWIELQDLEAAQAGRPAPVILFPGNLGGTRRVPVYVAENFFRYQLWHPLLTKAEVRRLDPHATRHTFASRLIANGENLKYVSEQLGHSSIRVTVDIYGHLIPGGNKQAVDRLDVLAVTPHTSGE